MTTAVPDSTETKILSKSDNSRVVWFQNFSTTVGFYLYPKQHSGVTSPTNKNQEFYLQPAASATEPSSLVLQVNSRDETNINSEWYAYQTSGGSANINAGKW